MERKALFLAGLAILFCGHQSVAHESGGAAGSSCDSAAVDELAFSSCVQSGQILNIIPTDPNSDRNAVLDGLIDRAQISVHFREGSDCELMAD